MRPLVAMDKILGHCQNIIFIIQMMTGVAHTESNNSLLVSKMGNCSCRLLSVLWGRGIQYIYYIPVLYIFLGGEISSLGGGFLVFECISSYSMCIEQSTNVCDYTTMIVSTEYGCMKICMLVPYLESNVKSVLYTRVISFLSEESHLLLRKNL